MGEVIIGTFSFHIAADLHKIKSKWGESRTGNRYIFSDNTPTKLPHQKERNGNTHTREGVNNKSKENTGQGGVLFLITPYLSIKQ